MIGKKFRIYLIIIITNIIVIFILYPNQPPQKPTPSLEKGFSRYLFPLKLMILSPQKTDHRWATLFETYTQKFEQLRMFFLHRHDPVFHAQIQALGDFSEFIPQSKFDCLKFPEIFFIQWHGRD